MDAMIIPSFFEGFPVTAIEAQASGLPVYLSDTITKEVIDRSICEATHGLIDHLDAELPTDTLAAIIDILYFKAKWWSRFDEYDTKERVFYGADGKTMVKMMKQTESYNYADTSLGLLPRT